MVAIMVLRLKDDPTTTASELRRLLFDQFGISVSRQLVSLVLRKRIGYSWKRTRKRGPVGVGWTVNDIDTFKQSFRKAFATGTLSAWDESPSMR
jgi:transposase